MLLMQPGPTQVDERVIQALCRPVVHHLSAEFEEVLDESCELLRALFRCSGEVVVLPATGRGGVEAALMAGAAGGGPVVVPTNGSFGRMVVRIGRSLGLSVVELAYGPGVEIPLEEVAAAVARHRPSAVAVVHCETSTGMTNDLSGYGEVAHDAGALLVADCVASLGGEELDTDALGIDLCVGAGQKAVGALTGTAFVAVADRALAAMQGAPSAPRPFYFDLRRWWDIWLPEERGGRLADGARRIPWSMPVHLVFALHEACRIAVREEGLAPRVARHRTMAAAARAGVLELGSTLLAPAGAESSTLTAFVPPPGGPAAALVKALRDRHGISVAGGLDDLAGRIVRIGHMAEAAHPGPLLQTLSALAYELGAPDSGATHCFLTEASATPDRMTHRPVS